MHSGLRMELMWCNCLPLRSLTLEFQSDILRWSLIAEMAIGTLTWIHL